MRKLLEFYRRLQYFICRRQRYGVMQIGVGVNVEPFRYDENHGDVVHPCVRYIADGFEGHNWWMVYTPYYKSNAAIENPILCYSENNDPNKPPTKWKHYCLVNDKPIDGYNSDPTLLYRDGQLFVFWRENYTEERKNRSFVRATYAGIVSNGEVQRLDDPFLITTEEEEDTETCPTFMPTLGSSTTMAYCMHLRFHSKRLKDFRPRLKRIINTLTLFTDLLGLYSQQKHYGIAIWKQQASFMHRFRYDKTVKFVNCNRLYRPWHMDFFDWEGRRYAIVQTNQSNADICLAWSDDGEQFTFYRKPLITNASIGRLGIYKPCAGVTPDGCFYLYYTSQHPQHRSINELFLSCMNFKQLMNNLI